MDPAAIYIIDAWVEDPHSGDDKSQGVWLGTTYWGEEFLTVLLAQALEKTRSYWSDPATVTRMLISLLFMPDHHNAHGATVSSFPPDNAPGRFVRIVDLQERSVYLADLGASFDDAGDWIGETSFEDFINAYRRGEEG
jgi:hypothetical protein